MTPKIYKASIAEEINLSTKERFCLASIGHHLFQKQKRLQHQKY